MQANKAGLLEIADIFVINKADRAGVRETRRDLEQMLDLGAERAWRPPILETVAATGAGTDALWASVNEHRAHLESTDLLSARRAVRLRAVLDRVLAAEALSRAERVAEGAAYESALARLAAGEDDPYHAAAALLRAS
jgi:LAO/AO transport system kinase